MSNRMSQQLSSFYFHIQQIRGRIALRRYLNFH
nr:MAG TPA: hypothetical protein [Caudoviricetes sp.]